jgi:hypothetical protein
MAKAQKPSVTYEQLVSNKGDIRYLYEPVTFGRNQFSAGELCFTPIPPHPFNPVNFAKDLDKYGSCVSVIADSSIYLAQTDQRIWDALLRNKQLRMISPVAIEIESWLKDSYNHKSDAITKFEIPAEHVNLIHAAEWYINLLGVRKKVRPMVKDGQFNGIGGPLDNCEANNAIRRMFGRRSERLATSGDHTKIRSHLFHDEAIVISAIIHALVTRQHTIILTRDEDIYEQFRKACWLLDTHYRSMRVAEIYANNPLVFTPIRRFKKADSNVQESLRKAFADEDVVLLGKPSAELREVLPAKRHGIVVHCCRIRELAEILMFSFIDDFRSLFRIKGQTRGLSTDKFGDKNCHIHLGPLTTSIGNWAAIGRDVTVGLDKFRYSMIDANLVINENEGTTTIRPTNLIVP